MTVKITDYALHLSDLRVNNFPAMIFGGIYVFNGQETNYIRVVKCRFWSSHDFCSDCWCHLSIECLGEHCKLVFIIHKFLKVTSLSVGLEPGLIASSKALLIHVIMMSYKSGDVTCCDI
jgi:hypothetical protein